MYAGPTVPVQMVLGSMRGTLAEAKVSKCDNCGCRDFEYEDGQNFCVGCGLQGFTSFSQDMELPASQYHQVTILSTQQKSFVLADQDRVVALKKAELDETNDASSQESAPTAAVFSNLLRRQCDCLIKHLEADERFRKCAFCLYMSFIDRVGVLYRDEALNADARLLHRRDHAILGMCKQRHTMEEMQMLFTCKNGRTFANSEKVAAVPIEDSSCDTPIGLGVQASAARISALLGSDGYRNYKSIRNRRLSLRHTIAILLMTASLLNMEIYLFDLHDMINKGVLPYEDAAEGLPCLGSYFDRHQFELRNMPDERSILEIIEHIAVLCQISMPLCTHQSILDAVKRLAVRLCLPQDAMAFIKRAFQLCPCSALVHKGLKRSLNIYQTHVIPISLAYVTFWLAMFFGEPCSDGRWDCSSLVARLLNRRSGTHEYFVINEWTKFIVDIAEFECSIEHTDQVVRKRRMNYQFGRKKKLSGSEDDLTDIISSHTPNSIPDRYRNICDSMMKSAIQSMGGGEEAKAPEYFRDTRLANFPASREKMNKLVRRIKPYVRESDGALSHCWVDLVRNQRPYASHRSHVLHKRSGSAYLYSLVRSMCLAVRADFKLTKAFYAQIWSHITSYLSADLDCLSPTSEPFV